MKSILLATIFSIISINLNAQNKDNNAQPIANGVELISKLSPIQFEYNSPTNILNQLPKGTQYGIDTQKLKEIFPQAVKKSYFSVTKGKSTPTQESVDKVDYNILIPFLIAAIQEQQKEIEKLKNKVN